MHPLDVISYAYVDNLADKFGWTSDFGPTLARSVASVILPKVCRANCCALTNSSAFRCLSALSP